MIALATGDLETIVRARFPTVSLHATALKTEIPRLAKDQEALNPIEDVVVSHMETASR